MELTSEQKTKINVLIANIIHENHNITAYRLTITGEYDYTEDYKAWSEVEEYMVESFDDQQKTDYAKLLEILVTEHVETVKPIETFHILTAPLLLRCLSFLNACGVSVWDILEILRD